MGSRRGWPAPQTPTQEFEVPKSMPHASVICLAPIIVQLVWRLRTRRSATLAGSRPLTSLQFFLTPWCIQKIEIAKRCAGLASLYEVLLTRDLCAVWTQPRQRVSQPANEVILERISPRCVKRDAGLCLHLR